MKNNEMSTDKYLRRLFDASNSPCLILLPDAPNYTIKDVNKAYLNIINLTKEELIGKSIIGYLSANMKRDLSNHASNLTDNLTKVKETKSFSKFVLHRTYLTDDIPSPIT